jgi:MscS family membrane protein
MEDILDYAIAGIDLSRWVIAFAYIVGSFIVGKLIAFISSHILRRLASKTKSKIDDIILAVVEKTLVFVILVLGIGVGVGKLGLDEKASLWMARIVGVLTTLAVAWVLDRGMDAIITEYLIPVVEKSESKLDDQLLPIVRKTARILIWALAILIALKNAGYDVGALIAGLGIGGAALALAAKDTLANLFGSIAVFMDRPFAVGDRIKVAGFDGTVKEIGIRTSRISTLDNRIVTIPNSIFASGAIENVSSEPNTKVSETIELSPEIGHEGAERAIAILREIAASNPGLDAGTVASLSSFGQYALKVSFVVFIKKSADYFETLNRLHLDIMRRFAEAGIEFARPQSLLLDKGAKR